MNAPANRFFDNFTASGRDRLIAGLIPGNYPPGGYLFQEGDAGDGVYLVQAGQVEIVRTAGHQEKVLDCIEVGDYLGEVAVLDGHGRSTGARARGDVTVARIPRALLLEVLASEPGASTLGLFQQVLTHLRHANDLIVLEVVQKEKLALVGEMAGSLMHDLSNPVAGIRMGVDLINMFHPDGRTTRQCDGIRLQCERLIAMAGELMEFSRGQTKLELQPTTTTAFLQQFQTLNKNYLDQSGVEVSGEAVPGEIVIDAMRLLRVMQNLVTNAVEALQATPQPRIEIRAWVDETVFHLTVKDNGPGIPTVIRHRIFEPFVTHGKSGGTGLGMAIAHKIVTAHGGTITFDSAPQQGTTFLIDLPRREPDPKPASN